MPQTILSRYRRWAKQPATRHTWAAGMAFFAAALCVVILLAGCTSTTPGVYGRSIADGGTMVGPYDITLTSHREGVFGKPGG